MANSLDALLADYDRQLHCQQMLTDAKRYNILSCACRERHAIGKHVFVLVRAIPYFQAALAAVVVVVVSRRRNLHKMCVLERVRLDTQTTQSHHKTQVDLEHTATTAVTGTVKVTATHRLP